MNRGTGFTRNSAVSHSGTNSHVLDYFSKMGSYRNRSLSDVWVDVAKAWGENPTQTLQAIMYNRMITRTTRFVGGYTSKTVQRGQGNRDESRKAFSWVCKYFPSVANDHLILFASVGTWKDLWHQDLIDYVDHEYLYNILHISMQDEFQRGLIAKYLPRIKSRNERKSDYHQKLFEFALGLCHFLEWNEEDYRKFKSDPKNTAHLWQRQMSAGEWGSIDFGKISGKALFNAVSQTGRDKQNWVQRHDLEDSYMEWAKNQPVMKFTGYPYELALAVIKGQTKLSLMQKMTYDKQFEGLLELAKSNGGITGNVLCAIDVSASMTWYELDQKGTRPYDVCTSLGVYFASLNTGAFHNVLVEFSSRSRFLQLSGTFTDKILQVMRSQGMGSTNFQSVIDAIVKMRRNNPHIPVSDFPSTLLVVSDMQFDPTADSQTNYEMAMRKLESVGLPRMNVIWWHVNGSYGNDFPSMKDDKGVTMLSGFDGATIGLILGDKEFESGDKPINELTPYEQMEKVLNQEVLRFVTVTM